MSDDPVKLRLVRPDGTPASALDVLIWDIRRDPPLFRLLIFAPLVALVVLAGIGAAVADLDNGLHYCVGYCARAGMVRAEGAGEGDCVCATVEEVRDER